MITYTYTIVFSIVIMTMAIFTVIQCSLFDETDFENGITIEDWKRELRKLFKMQDLIVHEDGTFEWK